MVVRVCDKCGKNLPTVTDCVTVSANQQYPVGVAMKKFQDKDLCQDCFADLVDWFKMKNPRIE